MTLLPSLPPALLAMSDGTVFHGHAVGALGSVCAEVVFNTAMSGYQEVLTDPSYHRQIVAFSYPHIGNVGCNEEDFESCANFAAGLVIRDLPVHAENWRMQETLSAYLNKHQVVAIAGIDTRALVRLLREKGTLVGCIMAGDVDAEKAIACAKQAAALPDADLASEVSTKAPYVWEEGAWSLSGFTKPDTSRFHVVAYDFGITRGSLRALAMQGCKVTVVPAATSAEEVMKLAPDGVFLSNGPGNPACYEGAATAINKLVAQKIPLLGEGLGHLLLALGCGAKTFRMPQARHGTNHPVKDLATGKVKITRQSQSFAVDASTLPENLKITHLSLFDGTVQGIECVGMPAFSFQGYPDADGKNGLFDRFARLMQELGEK